MSSAPSNERSRLGFLVQIRIARVSFFLHFLSPFVKAQLLDLMQSFDSSRSILLYLVAGVHFTTFSTRNKALLRTTRTDSAAGIATIFHAAWACAKHSDPAVHDFFVLFVMLKGWFPLRQLRRCLIKTIGTRHLPQVLNSLLDLSLTNSTRATVQAAAPNQVSRILIQI